MTTATSVATTTTYLDDHDHDDHDDDEHHDDGPGHDAAADRRCRRCPSRARRRRRTARPSRAIELGSIEIPRIGLTRSMFEGIRLSTLDNGPGHWPGTAMPGEIGNVVVAGHRVSHNRTSATSTSCCPATRSSCRPVAAGTCTTCGPRRSSRPTPIWIVDQTHARTATLFACHPPGSVRERIVVHLELQA